MGSTMSRAPLGGALLSWGSGVLGAGTLVYGGSTAFSDAPFLVSIILHLLLGIALTGVIFVAGSGLVLLTAREAPAVESLLLRAFVPGAVVAGLVAALIIFVHLGITIAIILILLVASPLLSYRPNGSALSRIKTGMFIILPVTLIFATEVGLLFHGPTGTISGAAHGDSALAIHYAVSISQQFAPLRNLGIEGAALGYAYFYSALLTGALL